MKKLMIFIIILLILGCSNVIKNKQTSINFNCPLPFFSSEDRIFIDNNNSLEDVLLKAELNNFEINESCQQKDKIVIIPLDLLIIANPMDDLQNPEINIPVYVSLLDKNDNILETQYFMVSGKLNKHSETNKYIETDIAGRLKVISQYLETYQLIVGFMLDDKKRKLLN